MSDCSESGKSEGSSRDECRLAFRRAIRFFFGKSRALLGRIESFLVPELPKGWLHVRRLGFQWLLNPAYFVDREIIEHGAFEEETTERMWQVLKPGMRVLDVGANFGYFTILAASRVGSEGHVWSAEPTRIFGDRLKAHVAANKMEDRVTLIPLALSDAKRQGSILIQDSTATFHGEGVPESVELNRLDDIVDRFGMEKVDLVKVDIDGHEPRFFAGAKNSLQKWKPTLVIEFSQSSLAHAGSSVEELKDIVESLGYELRSEKRWKRFENRLEFLKECANYSSSVNIWAIPKESSKDAVAD